VRPLPRALRAFVRRRSKEIAMAEACHVTQNTNQRSRQIRHFSLLNSLTRLPRFPTALLADMIRVSLKVPNRLASAPDKRGRRLP
jgi:hypothetical protein